MVIGVAEMRISTLGLMFFNTFSDCLASKHVLLVYDDNDGQAVFFLGAAGEVVQRGGTFRFAHHDVFVLVDALPVHEEHFTGMDVAACRMVQFIVCHGTEHTGFGEVILHLQVALLVQLVGRDPDKGHFTSFVRQLGGQFVQHLADHDGLAGAGRCLEH